MNSSKDQNAKLEFLREVADRNTIQIPSPFKKLHYKKPNRRHKPARQLITDEARRINTILQKDKENEDPHHHMLVPKVTFFNVEAPPAMKPTKKYCDITGLKGNYRSPTNNIRYHNSEIYQLIVKPMAPGIDQEYLKLA